MMKWVYPTCRYYAVEGHGEFPKDYDPEAQHKLGDTVA